MQLSNQVAFGGILGRDPTYYEAKGKKRAGCRILLAHNNRKPFPATWAMVNCSGNVADYVRDVIKARKGDAVTVQGFLGNWAQREVGPDGKKGMPSLVINAVAVALFYPGTRRSAKFFEQADDDPGAAPVGGFEGYFE